MSRPFLLLVYVWGTQIWHISFTPAWVVKRSDHIQFVKGINHPPTSKSSPPLVRSSPFLKIPHSPTLLPNPNTQPPQKHHIHLSFARPPLKSAICPSLPPFRQSSPIYCFYVNPLKNHIFQLTSILKFSFLNLILSFKSN